MASRRQASVVTLIGLILSCGSALATIVGGGGSSKTDCLAVFQADLNFPSTRPREIKCVDGDLCDADGTVNGVCELLVGICANSTFDSRCTLNGVATVAVDHALDNGDRKFDPEFQALQTRIDNSIDPPTNQTDVCTVPTHFHVRVIGPLSNGTCKRNTKTIKVVTKSKVISSHVYNDSDTFKLECDPAPQGCDPNAFYSGTFDRLQQQIFTPTCAVSACHDSQTQQNNLLLETGAAYGNLIGVAPTNPAAAGDGWQRVHITSPTTGDPTTSYLFRKVSGDLPSGAYGVRMPLVGPKLDQHLIDIIQLWIEAGAPDTGWVPGTDQ